MDEFDLIFRDDAIQALVDCDEIKGHGYVELMEALETIPKVPMPKNKKRTAFLVSTKAELITDKVNEWMEENPDVDIWNIIPFMSYTSIKDKGAMMIGCMIEYDIFEKEEHNEHRN